MKHNSKIIFSPMPGISYSLMEHLWIATLPDSNGGQEIVGKYATCSEAIEGFVPIVVAAIVKAGETYLKNAS